MMTTFVFKWLVTTNTLTEKQQHNYSKFCLIERSQSPI